MNILCPFHKDTHPSLSVDAEKGIFYCFACGAKGDVFGLASVLGMSVKDAAHVAFGDGEGSLLGLQRAREAAYPAASRTTGPPSRRALAWLERRGLNVGPSGELEGLDAKMLPRFSEGDGVLGISAWCAVARDGRLEWETWLYYRVMRKNARTRYFSTRGFPRGHCIGVAGAREGSVVYLSEGAFDGLAVLLAQDRLGLPRGATYYTFGAEVSQKQAMVINTLRRGKELILAYDNDQAGWDTTLALLRLFPDAKVLVYPGSDPGEGLLMEDARWRSVPGMEWLAERTTKEVRT